jgi:hypothetical protein
MNFLDPDQWDDLQALEKDHEELTEELVKQLHHRLRPYFLRRNKSEVLQLPPKVCPPRVPSCLPLIFFLLERGDRSRIHDSFAEECLSFNLEYVEAHTFRDWYPSRD